MEDLLQGLNIYLIGMMGTGKTTVGKILAQKLGYRFLDTDEAIEAVAGKKITEIFAEEGEENFRDLESKILNEVSAYIRSAIATGGGIIQRQMNWSYLRQGLIIWLDTDLKIIQERLSTDQSRPLASNLESLWSVRRPLYAQADLHIKIDNHQNPEDIVTQIIELIPSVINSKIDNS
ncbi:MAG: shikimate kinase [Xenococcaceae cyanobacterium MO_188.B29]|nr:shikimate kinase [Xenococcaceae cyanobacterium MO_188.B29]